MPDNQRLEDLRRRVQRDPASIAFAQLAEEYRRDGQYAESVEACRAGLALHPGYLSARVTLGRALIELDELADAQSELELVLKSAPENLAAIRGLADIFHKRGDLAAALAQYKTALALARNDPDLEETVNDLTRQLLPTRGPDPKDGLSLEQMRSVFESHVPATSPPILTVTPIATPPAAPSSESADVQSTATMPLSDTILTGSPDAAGPESDHGASSHDIPAAAGLPDILGVPGVDSVAPDPEPGPNPDRTRAILQIGALEQWLAAAHAARTEPDS